MSIMERSILWHRVSSALDRAVSNGYFAEATTADAEDIAEDLVSHDSDFEHVGAEDLVQPVREWISKRKT